MSGFSGVFAVGFLGSSLLDKYFAIIFSKHRSQFSKKAFQVALSSTSGQFEPDHRHSVPEDSSLDQGGVLQGSGPRGIGHLPSTEGLCTRVARNGHKSIGF